jgi:hypothetical protein
MNEQSNEIQPGGGQGGGVPTGGAQTGGGAHNEYWSKVQQTRAWSGFLVVAVSVAGIAFASYWGISKATGGSELLFNCRYPKQWFYCYRYSDHSILRY